MAVNTYFKSHELAELLETFIDQAIELAIEEDLGRERVDVTSAACVPSDCRASAVVLVKEPAIVAGIEIFERVMRSFHKSESGQKRGTARNASDSADALIIEPLIDEGSAVMQIPHEIIKLQGPAGTILAGERLALNLLQRMSGVATMTKQFVDKAKPLGIAILDTRKTTPCLRAFEKYAVAAVGGQNHRMGLFDNILIKDNHIRVAGSITKAVSAARAKYPDKEVEVETTTLTEVQEALDNKAEKIMLDNMAPDTVRQAVELIRGRSKIEVSGGINQKNIDQYLIGGVDYISIGALTHSVRAIDISLEILQLD